MIPSSNQFLSKESKGDERGLGSRARGWGGLQTDNKQMTIHNPYVENLVQMGYDRKDVETASTMFQKKTFPYTIHGRTYQTEEEYNDAIHEFMNGMWQSTKWHTTSRPDPDMVYYMFIGGGNDPNAL